jgi:hypothetical protein
MADGTSATMVERFYREAQAAARLKSVRVTDVGARTANR